MIDQELSRPTLDFYPQVPGQPQPWRVRYNGLEYAGEVIMAEARDPGWGSALEQGTYFRIVFLTTPRRIPASLIQDARIAIAIPGPYARTAKQSLQRELGAIKEARARYITGRGPEAAGLQQSIQERELTLQQEIVGLDARAYAQGRIVAQTGVSLDPLPIFSAERPEAWADQLASALLSRAYPALPIDPSAFPHTLSATDTIALFRGLFQGDEEARPLVEAFAPGLGLSRKDDPATLDLSECQALNLIGEELQSHGGEMSAQEMHAILADTHGLTPPLATLYLLAFVHRAQGEIELRPGHTVVARTGGPFLSDRITWDLISELSYTEGLSHSFHTLRLQPAPVWNTALPYAALLVEGLEPTQRPEEVATQEGRLLEALVAISKRIPEVRQSLEGLVDTSGQELAHALLLLEGMERLSAASSYTEFYSIALDGFGSPSALGQALDSYRHLEQLADLAPDITRVATYLEGITLGREHARLEIDLRSIREQIHLATLASNPSQWNSLRAFFDQFRSRYTAAYAAFHAAFNQETLSLSRRLEWASPQVEALRRFNTIPELGEAVGADVPQRFSDLEASVQVCPLAEEVLALQQVAYCSNCNLRMDEDAPTRQVESLLADLERAMREYNRRLGSSAVRRILSHQTKEQLEQLINIVQVSDLSALANVLDDEVVQFLREFLQRP